MIYGFHFINSKYNIEIVHVFKFLIQILLCVQYDKKKWNQIDVNRFRSELAAAMIEGIADQ